MWLWFWSRVWISLLGTTWHHRASLTLSAALSFFGLYWLPYWRLPPLLFLAVPEIGAGSGVGVSPTNSNGHQQHKESTHGTYDFRYS
jgi:hypothetical protein